MDRFDLCGCNRCRLLRIKLARRKEVFTAREFSSSQVAVSRLQRDYERADKNYQDSLTQFRDPHTRSKSCIHPIQPIDDPCGCGCEGIFNQYH